MLKFMTKQDNAIDKRRRNNYSIALLLERKRKMKNLKNLLKFSILLSLIFAMSVFINPNNVNAEGGENTITINNTNPGHVYNAYQIFAGIKSDNNLNKVTWGSGVSAEFKKSQEALAYAKKIEDRPNDIDTVTEDLANNLSDTYATSTYDDTAKNYNITDLDSGYYMLVDSTNDNVKDSYSKYLVQLVGDCDVTVELKNDTPSVTKKVKENSKEVSYDDDNKSEEYLGTGYNDVADYCVGDHVPFELIGTLPSNLTDYKTYKYIYHDTLSDGLDFDNDSLSITTDGKEIKDKFKVTYDNHKLTLACDDIKTVDGIKNGSKVIVKYTATLNGKAAIGQKGNENSVTLEYSNNPTKKGEGTTGTTPKDEAIVFTYELDANKIDSATKKVLPGAKFKLYKMNGEMKLYASIVDGKVTSWNKTGNEIVSGSDGLFKITGLDDGEYYLEETDAPSGYKKLNAPVKFVITASTNNDQDWNGDPATALTKLSITVNDKKQDGDVVNGIVTSTIENTSSVQLPSTGSQGTIALLIGGLFTIVTAILYKLRKFHD